MVFIFCQIAQYIYRYLYKRNIVKVHLFSADIIRECDNNSWVKAVEFYRTINSESPTVFSEKFCTFSTVPRVRYSGEGKARKKTGVLDDNTVMTKLPLASRMATFIRETTFELETLNSELQIYNEHLQDVAKTDAFYKLNARGNMR